MPAELPRISPGFYTAVSNAVMPPQDDLLRVYWHLTPQGGAPLISAVTTALNGLGVPFRVKVANTEDSYVRADAGVLYLQRDDFPKVQAIISAIHQDLNPYLAPAVPALTHRLADGLAVAEDPGDGHSFGLHRCNVLAAALVTGWEQGAASVPGRLEALVAGLNEAGINPDEPYLRTSVHGEDTRADHRSYTLDAS